MIQIFLDLCTMVLLLTLLGVVVLLCGYLYLWVDAQFHNYFNKERK